MTISLYHHLCNNQLLTACLPVLLLPAWAVLCFTNLRCCTSLQQAGHRHQLQLMHYVMSEAYNSTGMVCAISNHVVTFLWSSRRLP